MSHLRLLNKIVSLVFGIFILSSFGSEPDPLQKRVFNVSLSETKKDGSIAKKVIMDKIYFKNGKLFSDFINDKFGYKWIRYRINKDTVFVDSTQTKVRLLEVEASATNEVNQTVFINFVTSEWDIDGIVKITKNDKLKKYYDLAGREKGGKPKKKKRKAVKQDSLRNSEKKIKVIRDQY
jgi:hypothetical protein